MQALAEAVAELAAAKAAREAAEAAQMEAEAAWRQREQDLNQDFAAQLHAAWAEVGKWATRRDWASKACAFMSR